MKQTRRQQQKQQVLWFIGLWIAGVVVVASIAYAFRWLAGLAYH